MATTSGNGFAALSSRSLGAKFFVVLLLALGMSFAGFFVEGLVNDRAAVHGVAATSTAPAQTVLGVRLADSYRATYRSLHYITLFLGLVFLTYFLFETLTGKRVHLAQYALVGTGQTVFYLLLLSLAEQIGFDWSFAIAGGATVALFAVNTEWVFGSRRLAVRAGVAFALVYALIYVLLRMEAYALLLGAVASFCAVAAAMYLTRQVDWYGSGVAPAGATGRAAAGGGGGRESWLE